MVCINIKGTHYIVINNKWKNSEIISQINVDSIIKCAVHCSETHGCSQANFKNNEICELLEESHGDEVIDDRNSKLLRTYMFYIR